MQAGFRGFQFSALRRSPRASRFVSASPSFASDGQATAVFGIGFRQFVICPSCGIGLRTSLFKLNARNYRGGDGWVWLHSK